jgi:hypothetical protein
MLIVSPVVPRHRDVGILLCGPPDLGGAGEMSLPASHPEAGQEGVDLAVPVGDGHRDEGMVPVLLELGVLGGVDPDDPETPTLDGTSALLSGFLVA